MAEFKQWKKKDSVLAYKWDGPAGSIPTSDGVVGVSPGDYVVKVDSRIKSVGTISKDGVVSNEAQEHPVVSVVPGAQFEAEFESA
jgi:hypothetical protein